MSARYVSSIKPFEVESRVSGDASAGEPTVVIPLSRAVICGEDHIYDCQRFSVCPNCAAQDRLRLADLLANRGLPIPPPLRPIPITSAANTWWAL